MPRTEKAPGPTPTSLPYLGASSGKQRAMWGIAVAAALVLLGALAMRLGTNVELLQWWVPIPFVIGVALADLASGPRKILCVLEGDECRISLACCTLPLYAHDSLELSTWWRIGSGLRA